MWADEAVVYQIYPLGMCGAPFENDGIAAHRILRVLDWIPHLVRLGVTAVYFSPLFESDTHGYNTRDYRKCDTRLGTNDDLKTVFAALHDAGIRVVLDGVFNHVGRGFPQFQDVLRNRENSPYRDWFYINFGGNDGYNDGLWYEGWEGNFDLVKLNLDNPAASDYLMDSVRFWITEFGIDGLRLDVAYMVNREFLKRLRRETSEMKSDFFLAGEMIGGDYREIMNDAMCHSVTNYECRKGIYSSMNSMNLFEIKSSLERQFGSDPWCLYTGQHLLSFVDNHDVDRIASILTVKEHLPLCYALLYAMPGIPVIYYGSEWGIEGKKSDGDPALRPAVEKPEWNSLTDYIASLGKIRSEHKSLAYGSYRTLQITNRQYVFERETAEERIIFALNIDADPFRLSFDARAGRARELLTGQEADFGGGLTIPGYTAMFLLPF